MNWTRPQDLRAQVQKLWDKGVLLAALVAIGDSPVFPKRLLLKGPSVLEINDSFDAVRQWIAVLCDTPYCRIEMRTFNHRLFGGNAMPQAVWIDSLDDALALIGKRREAGRFQQLLVLTRQQQPAVLEYLVKRPLRVLELAEQWPALLEVVDWRLCHPRPAIYLRQVDLPGIHSKFIEAHRGVLSELFDLALPVEAVDFTVSGVARFAQRYGFLDKPVRVRFRVLDSELALLPGGGLQDITLDADSFAGLSVTVSRVFITENETNFLAFPPLKDSLLIFGAGYGWETLGKADWLAHCAIYYWGDIDTHGFAILNQLRSRFQHVESFLMDRKTLMAHQLLWGLEQDQVLHDLPNLNLDEKVLFDELRDNRIRPNLRLEQEMISFTWLQAAIKFTCEPGISYNSVRLN